MYIKRILAASRLCWRYGALSIYVSAVASLAIYQAGYACVNFASMRIGIMLVLSAAKIYSFLICRHQPYTLAGASQ